MNEKKEVTPVYLLRFGQLGERWCVALKTAEEIHYFVTLDELMLFLAQHARPPVAPPQTIPSEHDHLRFT